MEDGVNLLKTWLGSGSINIFGLPFSGKDTHGHELAKLFDANLISGGDILRNSKNLTHIHEHIAKGHLAPTDEYLATILPYFSQERFKNKPIIMSSIGRWHGEEPKVMKAATESSHPIKAVIYLSIEESESERRWKISNRGRDDDSAHHILLNRFNEFKDKTLPVIEFYRNIGLLIEVDAMPSEEAVTKDILKKLEAIATK